MDGKWSAHICAGTGEQEGRWAGGQKDKQSSVETQSRDLGAPANRGKVRGIRGMERGGGAGWCIGQGVQGMARGAGQDAERSGEHRPLTDALGPAMVLQFCTHWQPLLLPWSSQE